MSNSFDELPVRDLGRTYSMPTAMPAGNLSSGDSAVHLLIDFCQRRPPAISSDMGVSEARLWMKMADTTFKLVQNSAGDCTGIITIADVHGERPLSLANRRGDSLGEIRVKDVMTPLSRLPATHYRDLCKATAADLVNSFRSAGEQFILVLDDNGSSPETQCLRGLISATELVDKLHVPIDLAQRASTFTDIVNAVQGQF